MRSLRRASRTGALLLLFSTLAACDDATPEPPCPPAAERTARAGASAEYVIHISVDGLWPDALDGQPLPAFERLRAEGITTDNARADADSLPNHTTQLTGRGVAGPDGHNWRVNNDPDLGLTIHSNKAATSPARSTWCMTPG